MQALNHRVITRDPVPERVRIDSEPPLTAYKYISEKVKRDTIFQRSISPLRHQFE